MTGNVAQNWSLATGMHNVVRFDRKHSLKKARQKENKHTLTHPPRITPE
jgi:hypothetical protein